MYCSILIKSLFFANVTDKINNETNTKILRYINIDNINNIRVKPKGEIINGNILCKYIIILTYYIKINCKLYKII